MNREEFPRTVFEYFFKLFAAAHSDLDEKEMKQRAFQRWRTLDREDRDYLDKKFEDWRSVYKRQLEELDKMYANHLKRKHQQVDRAKAIAEGQKRNRSNNSTVTSNATTSSLQPKLSMPADPPKGPRELYEFLSSTDKYATPWRKLTQAQKCHYMNATKIVKKMYIKEYMEYLHSLSTEELVKLYNTTFSK